MKGRLREFVPAVKQILDEPFDATVSVAVLRPVIDGEHRRHRNGVHPVARQSQVRIVRVGELADDIEGGEGLGIRHRQEMKAGVRRYFRPEVDRLRHHPEEIGDLARPDHLHAGREVDKDRLDRDSEAREDDRAGQRRRAFVRSARRPTWIPGSSTSFASRSRSCTSRHARTSAPSKTCAARKWCLARPELDQGELDVANTTSQHLARAISEGMDVVWICGWGGGYNVLVAGKRLDLPTADDAALGAAILRRKREGKPIMIGVPTGSLQHAKLSFFLKSLGIDGERDTQIVNIPFPNHPRALEAGEVDMAMTLCVFGAIAIDKGDAKLVRHLFGDKSGKQEIGFIANRKLTQRKPELVQKIVSSHVEAMNTFMGNPDLRIELERKYSRLPDAVIGMQERQFLKYDYRTNLSDLKTMSKELRELRRVKEDYSDRVDRYIDLAFLAKATGRSPAQLSTW